MTQKVKPTNPATAFPFQNPGNFPGMTLRDYFAAQAAAPLMAAQIARMGSEGSVYDDAETAAIWAYALADALLFERGETD